MLTYFPIATGTTFHQPLADDFVPRPLTPIQDLIESSPPATAQCSVTKSHDFVENCYQFLAMEVLVHAKVYSFAHKYLIPDLEAFATHRLAQVLIILEHKQVEMLPQLAEAIQVIYSTTPSNSQNPARNLLSQFTALKFTALLGDCLDQLMAEGGEFTVDVSHKLAQKLLASPLEEKIEELKTRVSALEVERSGMEKDMDSLREDINGWESWNNRLPHSRRRPWPYQGFSLGVGGGVSVG